MAKTAGQVTKIYSLKTLGYSDLTKQLDNVAKKFEAIRKSKLSAQGKLALTQDIVEIKRYSDEIEKLILEEQQLRVETQRLTNEQKAANIQRQADLDLQKKKRAANKGEAGSIAEIRQEIKDLNAALILKNQGGSGLINFKGDILTIDQATGKLKQLITAEQDFRRQFARDGLLVAEYTSGIVQAFKSMGLDDLVGAQINKTQKNVEELNKDFDRLQRELEETKKAGTSTDTIERQMIDNRKEVIALQGTLKQLRTDFHGVGDVGTQVSSSINRGFQSLKGQVSSFALQYIGITALISKTQQGIAEAKLSSDQSTDLEIQLGGTADEAERLNKELKALNTRTTLTGLQEIADVALRAGASKEEIAGITAAIDRVKVAFGKDFGNVEQGTETFAKLINIFFEDGEITGDRILKMGNSIRALANETVASVPYLTDFSGRMAGVKQIANVTLPDILGLGAGFQEFQQSAEVASTVLVKVIPKLASDTAKYAEVIGVTQEEFSNLINTNPAEALIKVSEALVKSGEGIEDISQALADSELGSGRITTIIATLGGKADIFRERIARAGVTMEETGAITDAFNKKNTNLAATMDKNNKRFQDFFASKGFQTVLGIVSGLLLVIIGNLPIILSLVGLLTVAWAAQNITLIGLRAQLILYNLGIGANLVLINALRVANVAYTATMFILNGAYALVTRAAALFNLTIGKTPLGILLTGVALLAGAFKAFGGAINTGKNELTKMNEQLKINRDIAREAAKATTEQRAAATLLVGVVKDLSISEETRMAALKKLIDLDPIFQKTLTDGKINYDELNKALGTYIINITRVAELEAARARQAREFSKLQDLSIKKQDLEFAISSKNFDELDQQTKDLLANESLQLDIFGRPKNVSKSEFLAGARRVLDNFNKQISEQAASVDAAQKVFNEKQKEIEANAQKAAAEMNKNAPEVKPFDIDIAALQKDIENLDKQIKEFKGLQKDLDKLISDRNKKQAQLDKALGNNKTGPPARASKLTAEQKDQFKDIDAERDRLIAEDKQSFAERQLDEETFLFNIYQFNIDAINKKLKLLKGKNAEERKQIAELNLEKVTLEQETNDKVFELRAKALKDRFDLEVDNAKEEALRVNQDPDATATQRAQAELDADNRILAAQILFNADMDKLEKGRNNISKKNAEDRAREQRNIQAKLNEDIRKLFEAQIQDEEDAGERVLSEFRNIMSRQREIILNSNKTAAQKQSSLDQLEKQSQFGILVRDIARMKVELPKYKAALEAKAITEKQYADFYEEYVERLAQLNALLQSNQFATPTTVKGLVTNELSDLFGFKQGSEEAKLFAETVSQSFDLAKTAMDNYYAAEAETINRSRDLQLARLEQEKEQVLARSQSAAEQESITKQFAAKQDAINREAFEKNKKLQREQAKINLAIQLSNLAVIAFSPGPANIATLGLAGAIMYAIQAAIAVANYAMNIRRINAAQYEFGGQPGEVPVRGGEFGGKPHSKGGTDFHFKGRKYNAEVKELAVVRTKDAPRNKKFRVEGTQMQIASAANMIGGGRNFKPGAKLTRFETGGMLGDSLQAPVFTAFGQSTAVNTGGVTEEKMDELIEEVKRNNQAQSQRIDRLQVLQVTSTVTDAQKKRVKQSNIATF